MYQSLRQFLALTLSLILTFECLKSSFLGGASYHVNSIYMFYKQVIYINFAVIFIEINNGNLCSVSNDRV